jgi:hypothetical protein
MVYKRWTILSLAAVTALALACSGDHAIPGAPGAAIREGAHVSAQGTARFHFVNGGTDTTVAWASAAVVKGGVAMAGRRSAPVSLSEAAAGLLPQLAVADRAASGTRGVQTFTYTDTTKHHNYRLVATPGPAAGAPARLESFLDGQKVTQSDFAWTRAAGGWRVRSAHHTLYYRGAVVAEQDVTATSTDVSAASFDLMRPLARLGSALQPTDLQATTSNDCVGEAAVYVGALRQYAAAIAQYYTDPTFRNQTEMVGAGALFFCAEYMLLRCLYPNAF